MDYIQPGTTAAFSRMNVLNLLIQQKACVKLLVIYPTTGSPYLNIGVICVFVRSPYFAIRTPKLSNDYDASMKVSLSQYDAPNVELHAAAYQTGVCRASRGRGIASHPRAAGQMVRPGIR